MAELRLSYMHRILGKHCSTVFLAMFPKLQEFVMSLKQCSLIRGVAIVKALMSLARVALEIRIFLSRCLIGRIFCISG